jgi:4-amino-4-deoxy-L-arabinose transferase-like glycosyltransferase
MAESKKKDIWFLGAVLVVAFLLRVAKLGSQSLWVDEVLSLGKIIPKPGLNIWDYIFYNIQGPFHALVVHVFHFVSVNDGWLRLPSALAGTAAVYYLYRWAGLWLGPRVARLATVILVVHPLHIFYSQELRAYSFLFLFTVFSCYQLHRVLTSETRGGWARYIIGIALSALSNFSAAFLYATHAVIYLVRRGFSKRRLLHWVVASLLIAILISPWIYRIYVVIDVPSLIAPRSPGEIPVDHRLRGETTFTPAAVPYLFYTFSVGFTLGPSLRELHTVTSMASVVRQYWGAILWVGLLFGSLGIAGARWIWMNNRNWAQAALYLLLPLAFVLLICWQNAKAFNVRYLLVSLPAFICLIAAGIQSFRPLVARVLSALVLITMLVSLGNYYFNARYAKEDVRGATRYLEETAGAADCLLVPTVTGVFEYYYRGNNLLYQYYSPAVGTAADAREQLQQLFEECSGVWYLRTREWDQDPNGILIETLGVEYDVADRVEEFDGVKLIRYEKKATDD